MTMRILTLLFVLVTSLLSAAERNAKAPVTIAFLGDSITQQGWNKPNGYVHLVCLGLEANGLTINPVPAGISGHKSNDMLSRLDKDVISKKPQMMTLSCGVNDVWHHERGVKLPEYKQNINAILDAAAKANIKVVIMTASMITEKLDGPDNQTLATYNDFLRDQAKVRNLQLADVMADFQAALATGGGNGGNRFTVDGVHMNPAGDRIMATSILRAMGLNDGQVKLAVAAWDKLQ